MHPNGRLLFEKYARDFLPENVRVLEIGPDSLPSTYQRSAGKQNLRWDTLEIRKTKNQALLSAVTHVADDEYAFPIEDASYDVVVAGQVIEHVRKVWLWMKELSRVCRSGGLVITICPVTWPYHEDPVDCWRIYPEGMRALCEEAGLQSLLVICENAEPPFDPRTARWFLTKQTLKAYLGGEPFLAPLAQACSPVLDTISIARKL